MNQEPARNKGRETVLTIALTFVMGGAFFFFLNLVSLGVFFYVLAAVFGMTAVGFLHYVLWGYAFSQEVAGEREEEELRRRLEAEEHAPPDPLSNQRY